MTAPDSGRAGEPEQVVGDVVEQDPDVGRPPGGAQGVEECGPAAALLEDLAIGPRPLADQENPTPSSSAR